MFYNLQLCLLGWQITYSLAKANERGMSQDRLQMEESLPGP